MAVNGNKTYVVAALMLAMGLSEMWTPTGFDWQQGINYIFGGGALATIRSAMAKQEVK